MTNIDEQSANDERLEQRSREIFDAGVTGIDARTRARLNQARLAALDAARGHPAVALRWLLPVGGTAALALVALATVQVMRSDETPAAQEMNLVAGTVDDLDIIASSEALEMLKDVEFYAWLETQPDGPGDMDEAG